MNAEDIIKNVMSAINADDLWWGWHKDYGWVVLDRKLEELNKNLQELTFICCSDGSIFLDKKINWNPPLYVYAGNFLKQLSDSEINKHIDLLIDYSKKLPEFRRNIITQLENEKFEEIQRIHSTYLKSHNIDFVGIAYAKHKQRQSHCWNCKQIVDNERDYECNLCGWIICAGCGACGCGKPNRQMQEIDPVCITCDSCGHSVPISEIVPKILEKFPELDNGYGNFHIPQIVLEKLICKRCRKKMVSVT